MKFVFCFGFYLQCEKNGDVKKRRSNQADIPDNLRQEVEACYQLRLPEDFYQFWKFCKELDPEKPSGGFQNIFLPFLIFAFKNSLKAGKLEGVKCILMLLQCSVKMKDI